MNATAIAVTGYAAWLLLLLTVLIGQRIVLSARTGRPANSYRPDGSDVSPFAQRLCAAHANCVESFPFIGGPALVALATGNADVTDPLALTLLSARIGQSSVHLYAVSEPAVRVRAALFVVQVAIAAAWVAELPIRFLR